MKEVRLRGTIYLFKLSYIKLVSNRAHTWNQICLALSMCTFFYTYCNNISVHSHCELVSKQADNDNNTLTFSVVSRVTET